MIFKEDTTVSLVITFLIQSATTGQCNKFKTYYLSLQISKSTNRLEETMVGGVEGGGGGGGIISQLVKSFHAISQLVRLFGGVTVCLLDFGRVLLQ